MHKKITLMLAVLFTSFLCISMTADASETGIVTAMSEKIYLENKTDSAVLANMLEGTALEIILTVTDENGGTWYYVRTDAGLEGYMPADSIDITQNAQAVDTQIQQENEVVQEEVQQDDGNEEEQIHQNTLIALDNVNIRQEPTADSAQIGIIIKGAEAEYTAAYTNDNGEIWYAVTYQGIAGYVTASAVEAGEISAEPQPWTPDTVIAEVTEEASKTNSRIETEDTGTSQTQELTETVQTEEQQTLEILEQEKKQKAKFHLPELFEVMICLGIIVCIAFIVYIIWKIRLMFKKNH